MLRDKLPREVQAALLRNEAVGTTESEAYLEGMRVFYERHVCRTLPWPREFMASFLEISNDPTVYYRMNGPSEFHVIGTLRDWSVVEDVARIEVPTLLISGRHDEATLATVQPFYDRIPNARWEIFEDSSHVPHIEEHARFKSVMVDFLKSVQ